MSLVDRLIARLGKVFSRDPEIVPAVTITRNAVYTKIVATDGFSYELNIFENAADASVGEASSFTFDDGTAVLADDGTPVAADGPGGTSSGDAVSSFIFDDGSAVLSDDGTPVVADNPGGATTDIAGTYLPVFQRFPDPPATPTTIASDGAFYNLEIYENDDGTYSHGYIRLAGSGTFGAATFAAIDGYRYQLAMADNGDGTFSDIYTRVLGGDAGGLTPTTLSVKDLTLTIQADGQISIDLSSGTLNDLAAAISGRTGFNAVLIDPGKGNLLARGIYEISDQDISQDQQLYYPTALLYNEMQTYSWALMDQSNRIQSAENQLYMNTAEDDWLDYWGNTFFDIPRYAGEADETYAQRITNQVLRASQNGVALEIIIKQTLGIDVSVVDAASVLGQLTTDEQSSAPGRFILEDLSINGGWLTDQQAATVAQAEALANRYKAAGTAVLKHLITMLLQQVETVSTIETMLTTILLGFHDTITPGPIRASAGWRASTPGLKAGDNDAIKEQIFVQQVSTIDGAVTAKYLYGG